MKTLEITAQILQHFKNRNSFTRNELLDFYNLYEPELNNRTFGWRVFELKKKHVIHSVGRGIYAINRRAPFQAVEEPIYREIHEQIMGQLSVLGEHRLKKEIYCIWDTKWMNRYIDQQLFKTFIVLEISEPYLETVFFGLKDCGLTNVFIKPNREMFSRYIMDTENPVVLKPLYTRSPIKKEKGIRYASIEKILVDVYCDKQYFDFLHGSEMNNFTQNVIAMHNIDFSKLINYAARRRCREELRNILIMYLDDDLKGQFL